MRPRRARPPPRRLACDPGDRRARLPRAPATRGTRSKPRRPTARGPRSYRAASASPAERCSPRCRRETPSSIPGSRPGASISGRCAMSLREGLVHELNASSSPRLFAPRVLLLSRGGPRRCMTSEAEPYSMLEWVTVERARMADGTEFLLGRHGDGWVIRVGARVLMSNRMHGSEEALAEVALARVDSPRAVLVGGLGLGYTVRAVLDSVSAEAEITVLELVPELVDWNRRHLGYLAGHPLADRRCQVVVGDVYDTLRKSPAAFD